MAFSAFDGVTIQGTFFTLVVLYVASKALSFRHSLQAVGYLPGFRVPFHPFSLLGALLPTSRWNPGLILIWKLRDGTLYNHFGNSTISLVPFLAGPPTIITADLDVARQVSANKGMKTFEKPDSANAIFIQWGMNVFAANGEVWKKHKRIMGPAFNNKLYESVWKETLRTYREMVSDEGWSTKERSGVFSVQSLAFKLTLLIIGKCGFGFPFSWSEPARTSDGRMSLQEALRISADTFLVSLFVPEQMQKLPIKKLRDTFEAKRELLKFMQEQVTERKIDAGARGSGESVGKSDAFSMLVEASENEEAKYQLNDSELIGNVYILLLAGHETTARGISTTLAFLCLDDSLQEEIYQHIISVVGHEREPVYDDYSELNKVAGALLEALRMFPPAYMLVREAFEDTLLQIPNSHGKEGNRSVPIVKGTQVLIDLVGIHRNPKYFDNPEEYIPSRWSAMSNELDAISTFGLGPRSCIGRKFALVEVVCLLTILLREYKVEPLLDKNETKEQWKQRVMSVKVALSLGIKDVPIAFVRR
ncbi:hypothetical protein HYPSUDRAFT_67727 [Hypholoma sublateritium FD-334 SS-4]|uniref:Cytochrome P450 n=1 Tax=Hypholoma sublateritium (strain FD-334 SS-4) TaxID=945553 RepID=A0A0D2PNA8_HYPSF|nr:hypothetical protein HYPSUDRAFT_67727 [Hypholoma sublateritium FD-334 SS-4]